MLITCGSLRPRLTPMNDQERISPYNTNTILDRKEMNIM